MKRCDYYKSRYKDLEADLERKTEVVIDKKYFQKRFNPEQRKIIAKYLMFCEKVTTNEIHEQLGVRKETLRQIRIDGKKFEENEEVEEGSDMSYDDIEEYDIDDYEKESDDECEIDEKYTNDACKLYQRYYNDILSLLMNTNLPKLTEQWWHYILEVSLDSIFVSICNGSDLEVEDGCISSMKIEFQDKLLEVKANYISIEEYSEIHRVSISTVEKWIKRGFLYSIMKAENNQWLISDLESFPTGECLSAGYDVIKERKIDIPGYPLSRISKHIFVYQDSNNNKYGCTFINDEIDLRISLNLTKLKAEKLQYLLNICEDVETDAWVNKIPVSY